MKKLLTVLALLLFSAPSYAACVMGLDGADRAIAEYKMVKHVFSDQRLAALVEVLRERAPGFALEGGTTSVWLLELPEGNVGFVIEISDKDKCVTYTPEQAPLAIVRHLILEVSKRTAGA